MMEERKIYDERLDDLAQTLADMLGVDKTEAMRLALQNEIERLRSTPTIDDQIATLRETVKNYGRKSTRMVHHSVDSAEHQRLNDTSLGHSIGSMTSITVRCTSQCGCSSASPASSRFSAPTSWM